MEFTDLFTFVVDLVITAFRAFFHFSLGTTFLNLCISLTAVSVVAYVLMHWYLQRQAESHTSDYVMMLSSLRDDSLVQNGKVLCIVNPVGGSGAAWRLYQRWARPGLQNLGGLVETLKTEYAGHGLSVLRKKGTDLSQYSAILCCGGDGMAREVLTGLRLAQEDALARPHLSKKDAAVAARLSKVPLIVMPAGSYNGIAWTYRVGTPLRAMVAMGQGSTEPLDLMEVSFKPTGANTSDTIDVEEAPDQDPDAVRALRQFGFCHVSWGFLGYHDLYHERRFRWMGPALKKWASLLPVLYQMPVVRATVSFLPSVSDGDTFTRIKLVSQYYKDWTSLPKDPKRPGWRLIPYNEFTVITLINIPRAGEDVIMSPFGSASDGLMDLVVAPHTSTRIQTAKYFMDTETGMHVRSPMTQMYKVREAVWEISGSSEEDISSVPCPMSVDGSVFPLSPGTVHIKLEGSAAAVVAFPPERESELRSESAASESPAKKAAAEVVNLINRTDKIPQASVKASVQSVRIDGSDWKPDDVVDAPTETGSKANSASQDRLEDSKSNRLSASKPATFRDTEEVVRGAQELLRKRKQATEKEKKSE